MFQAIENFFSSENFMPHGHCFLWQPDILWLHVLSDAAITMAYFAIPLVLIYVLKKRQDLPFENVFFLFASFILFCGLTHAMSIWVLWNPDYAVEGVLKMLTALASLATLAVMIRLAPRMIALPTPSQLSEANVKLKSAHDTEVQHQQLMDKLMRSNTELERFAYVASHDMQEPVRMVMNFGRIIAHDYGDRLDETGKEYLSFITDSADRIHHIIDDLLEYARIDGEGQAAVLVDGTTEIDHVLANLDALIKEHSACVTCDRMPQFYGNPIQFMRLMQNLIANAIKYQKPGSAPVIHVGVKDQGSMWCISIQDNGLGIDESFTDRIFEPFRRLHSWEDIKGTGLGLAVCKKIVENHGGKIWVSSIPKQGSTFFISLPKSNNAKEKAA